MRYRRVRFLGAKASQGEAFQAVQNPADVMLVERGAPRSVVMKCPDGCGETLTINLDRRTGKAWRFYQRADGVSLYPSVWRTTGCRSHFIVWEDGIYWNDGGDEARRSDGDSRLKASVLERLSADSYTSFETIADELEQIPWAIAAICRALVREGVAAEGADNLEGHFRAIAAQD